MGRRVKRQNSPAALSIISHTHTKVLDEFCRRSRTIAAQSQPPAVEEHAASQSAGSEAPERPAAVESGQQLRRVVSMVPLNC